MSTRSRVSKPRNKPGASTKGKAVAARPQRDADTSRYRGLLGAAVRARREKLNLSVEEFLARLAAEGVELTAPSLYSYEIGHRPIQVDHLPAFAAALKTTVKNLVPNA